MARYTTNLIIFILSGNRLRIQDEKNTFSILCYWRMTLFGFGGLWYTGAPAETGSRRAGKVKGHNTSAHPFASLLRTEKEALFRGTPQGIHNTKDCFRHDLGAIIHSESFILSYWSVCGTLLSAYNPNIEIHSISGKKIMWYAFLTSKPQIYIYTKWK